MKEVEIVTGRYQIPTGRGLIDIEISKGVVSIGADILESFIYKPSPPQIINSIYNEAREILKNSLPSIETANELTINRWLKENTDNRLCFETLRVVPEDVLAILDIASVARALSRKGLKNILELAVANDERLKVPFVGANKIDIAKALRDLASNSLKASTQITHEDNPTELSA